MAYQELTDKGIVTSHDSCSSKLTSKRTSKRKNSGHDRNIFGENHSETAKEK